MKISYLFLLLLLFQPTLTGATGSPRYDLAYHWDVDIHRALEYQKKVAPLLGLTIDSQLQIVGRGQQYGVVSTVNGTLAQARNAAKKQIMKLQRAGFKKAQPTQSNDYHRLYNVSYTQGSNLGVLKKEYLRIKGALGAQVGVNLFIEKIDTRTFAIVYRCWGSRPAALHFAKRNGGLLKDKKISPSIIVAVNRPIVHDESGPRSGTRIAADRQGSRTDHSPTILQGPAKKKQAQPQTGIAAQQASANTPGQNPPKGQALPPAAPTGLNNRMAAFLQDQKKKGRIPQKARTAWIVYDLTNNTYVVSINSHRPFQAASMIKPFVALAFFHQVDKGKLSYTPQHRHMMEAMIQHSSNPATNWFIRQVGGPARCEAILKKEYNQFFKQVKIKEYIPPDGRTYKNSAQPSEYIQYLRALWNHQLPYSKEMLRVMSLPGRDRIFYGTEVPHDTLVYNKTGTTAHLCGDMGILAPRGKNGGRAPYAIVGIVERPTKPADYKQWMHTSGGVIRDFSTLVYEEMKQKHNLL